MESPNMYESQAHQVGPQQLTGELKKPGQIIVTNGNAQNNNNSNNNNNNNGAPNHSTNNNNNNSNNNNNNSNLHVNHNQTPSGVSKVSASKASLHQQYAEHCAAAGELTDLNTPEISLDLQHLIEDSHFNDGLLDIFSAGSNANGTVQLKHTRLPGAAAGNGGGGGHNGYPRAAALAYMPQPVHSAASYHHGSNSCSDSSSNSSSESPSIKEEPLDPADYRRHCQQYAPGAYNPAASGLFSGAVAATAASTFTTLTPTAVPVTSGLPTAVLHQTPGTQQSQQQQQPARPGLKVAVNVNLTQQQQQQQQHSHHQQQQAHHQQHQQQQAHHGLGGAHGHGVPSSRKQSKSVDKASDEYRRRRERNNIAVRKSREKAKVRSRETEERVKHLHKENDQLRKKVEILSEELSVLRSLFSSVPEQFQREISRHLDQYQQLVTGPLM